MFSISVSCGMMTEQDLLRRANCALILGDQRLSKRAKYCNGHFVIK